SAIRSGGSAGAFIQRGDAADPSFCLMVAAFSFSFDFERSTLNTPCWDAPGRIAVRDHNPAGVTKQANDRAEIVSQRFALAFQRFSFPLPGSHHDDVAIWTVLQEN